MLCYSWISSKVHSEVVSLASYCRHAGADDGRRQPSRRRGDWAPSRWIRHHDGARNASSENSVRSQLPLCRRPFAIRQRSRWNNEILQSDAPHVRRDQLSTRRRQRRHRFESSEHLRKWRSNFAAKESNSFAGSRSTEDGRRSAAAEKTVSCGHEGGEQRQHHQQPQEQLVWIDASFNNGSSVWLSQGARLWR